ncbi:MAG: acyltransferase [Tannerellaceae bacterium]|jgi:peptidoglycan/LPS O-acetylase OafA/YrhL|nr:acyltransferase [Tannerellaceae bacterium]
MTEARASEPILGTKAHYEILDGLRGVAALMVVAFHILEAHATSHLDQVINHGYLAVDFFFVLSGFVIGYAYDDRWGKMPAGVFFKRRLIRLQPMIVMGMIVGAVCFYFQDSAAFPAIHDVPMGKMLLIMLIGMTLLPVTVSMDIRGWDEMHPLDGPAWTLFFEYIANILYALFIRKFSNTLLAILVFLTGCALIHLAVTSPSGDIIGGWSLTAEQVRIGFTRLMYPFFAGLLLFRMSKLKDVKHAFLWCSLLIVVLLGMPRIGGSEHLWANGLYDSLVVIFIFPLIVFLGASGSLKGKYASRVCKFFGDISYPIYITHYPLIYIYTGWVSDNKQPFSKTWDVALFVFILSIALAYACLKFYDEPLRRWLKRW